MRSAAVAALSLSGCALLTALLPAALAQGADKPTILVDIYAAPGQNKVPLALPETRGAPGSDLDTFYAVVRNDLELSGWVTLVDSNASLEPADAGVRLGEFSFSDWDTTNAAALAKTDLSARGEGLRSEVWVYDIAGRRKLGAKAFTTSNVRVLAHKVANEIIYQITGQQGVFNTRFAFSAKWSGSKEIYIVDFDGFNPRRVTRNASINIQPSWSPSGRKLAFTSYLAGNPDLYVADLGSGRITRLSARNGINTGGAFSPAGDALALTLSPNGDPDIFTLDATTGRQISRLTNNIGIDASPAFSPDGSRIAFVSERSGGAQIYTMNADGSGVKRVTFQGGHNTDPVWSPDGTHLAYVSRIGGRFDVHVVKLDNKKVTRLTQDMGDNEDPSWGPNSQYVAFSSTRTGAAHIWMSTIDGVHQVQLTQGGGGYTNPSWSPPLDW